MDSKLRRKIRTEQRQIINDVHSKKHLVLIKAHSMVQLLVSCPAGNRDDMTIPTDLVKSVKGLDNLFKKVVAPKEAAIDAEGFRLLSSIGREQVESAHGSLVEFDSASYAEKLITHMGGRHGSSGVQLGNLKWAQLGDQAAIAFHKPPTTNFL